MVDKLKSVAAGERLHRKSSLDSVHCAGLTALVNLQAVEHALAALRGGEHAQHGLQALDLPGEVLGDHLAAVERNHSVYVE